MTAWTDFCKAYAAEHKISYKQAMKDASASYKSVGKPVNKQVEPVEEPKVEEPKVEEPKYIMTGCVANGFPVWEDSITLPPQIKHKRAPKKIKEAFPLNVEEILKTEPEVVKKEKKVKKA